MQSTRKGFDRTIGVAFMVFIVMGIPDGLLGLAWPSMRTEFNLPLDAIGAFLLAFTLGFLVTSFSSGSLIKRMGVGRLLLIACVVRGGAALAIFLAPSWALIVVAGVFFGLGTAVFDAGLNTYVATYQNNRLMNWLHAAFGVGATLGPLLMTALFAEGFSWRWGYAIVGTAQLLLFIPFALTYARWRVADSVDEGGRPDAAPMLATLRLPLAWIGIGLFFFSTGIEVSGGQWPYSLFTEERFIQLGYGAFGWITPGRGIDPELAGIVVSMYWGSFTVGRIFFGIIGDHWPETRVLRTVIAAMLTGAVLISVTGFPGADWLNFAGMLMLGFGLAPAFPMLINSTAARISPRHAANAIGFQVGAASLGGAVLPGLVGVFAERISLEVIGPALVAMILIQMLLYELLVRTSTRRARVLTPAPVAAPLG